MTEAEWLVCADGNRLISHLRGGSDRKLRLVGCALCRAIWVRLSPLAKEATDAAEGYADGIVSKQLRDEYYRRLQLAGGDDCHRVGKWLPACAVSECGWYAAELTVGSDDVGAELEVSLIRDIFGNPFRPATLDRSWLTSTVVALARGIYEERAFDRMPILADALQDAGRDSD